MGFNRISNRSFILLIALILFSFGIIGCSNPTFSFPSLTLSGKTGSIKVSIQQSLANAKNLLPSLNMNPASYTISGSGPSSAIFSKTITTGTASIPNLAVGAWTIIVQAFNADSTPTQIGLGSGTAMVTAGGSTTVSISVLPLSGNGTLTINLTWPSNVITSPAIVATLTPTTGTASSMTFMVGSTSASYTSSSIPAGYYTLSIQINDGSTNVAGKTDTVRILSGQSTNGTYTWTSVNQLQIGNINVNITPSLASPFVVRISGGQSTMTAGTTLTLTASVSNYAGTPSYAWYVNGVSQNVSTATWSGGSSWAAGYYTIDVTAISSDGKTAGSETLQVGVTSLTDVPQAPSLSSMVGTWQQNNVVTNIGSVDAYTTTATIAADGTFSGVMADTNTPTSGSATTTYSGRQGTMSVSGNTITMTMTKNYSGSSTVIPVSSATGWTTFTPAIVMTVPAISVNGNYYFSFDGNGSGVYTAQGTVSGLTGTWVESGYYSQATPPYVLFQITFAGGTFSEATYSSATQTMPSTPSSTTSGTYIAANGVLTSTIGGSPISSSYVIYGSNLITASGISANAGAWVKQ